MLGRWRRLGWPGAAVILLAFGGGVAASLSPASAQAGELALVVTNVGSNAGRMRVLVCTAEQFLQPSCPVRARVPARRGAMLIPLGAVAPGRWAVTAHHDADDDGDVNQNFLGIPTEGIGFSRNPGFRLGAPRFDDVAVTVGDAPVRIEVTLRFEPGG